MIRKATLLAPLALSLSFAALAQPAVAPGLEPGLAEESAPLSHGGQNSALDRLESFSATYRTPAARQVRIEQRVIVRIAPSSMMPRQSMFAELQQMPPPTRLVERKMEDCIAVSNIAGVQTTSSNRLVLYLRDRRMVTASLEKSCRARDYYSGFYLERNEDGRLCVGRDKLKSRTGANCEISRMRQLVPVDS